MMPLSNKAEQKTKTELEVIAEKNTFRCVPNGGMHGIVSFKIGSKYFPTSDWHDFVTVLVEWWLRALIPLIRGKKTHAELLFMEGPYQVDVDLVSPETVGLRFVDRGREDFGKNDYENVTVKVFPLIEKLLRASDIVISASRELRCRGRDLDSLELTVKDVRKKLGMDPV
jgi:hypothetical protein